MNEAFEANHARSLSVIVSELREELKQFLNTRLQMLKSELHDGLSAIRVGVPFGVLSLLFVITGFFLVTAAVVAIVASAFAGTPYAWFYGLIIVGVLWFLFGGVAAFFGYNAFRSKPVFPKRTLEVLKADKTWIESEARTTNYGRAA
ncbi:MAG TPA: phage holin family protein [Terriglobales bacterium]|nr:phage holin family protein [Terriglobales bacterium]